MASTTSVRNRLAALQNLPHLIQALLWVCFLVKPSDIQVTPRRKSGNKRVMSGAQVVTSAEILSLLKEKEEKKKKRSRRKGPKKDRKRETEETA